MNVSGQEVATGIADPLTMFQVVAAISVIAIIGYLIWFIINNMR